METTLEKRYLPWSSNRCKVELRSGRLSGVAKLEPVAKEKSDIFCENE